MSNLCTDSAVALNRTFGTAMLLWYMQISAGQKLTGRTCATALPACERQGVIWVYPAPGAAPSQDSIPSQLACLHWQQTALLCMAKFAPLHLSPAAAAGCLLLEGKHVLQA